MPTSQSDSGNPSIAIANGDDESPPAFSDVANLSSIMKNRFEATMPSINRILRNRDVRDRIPEFAWKICVPNFMPLSIEWIGEGPRGLSMISVMHTYTQQGDMMRDPDVEMECQWDSHSNKWRFFPVSYRQDGLGLNRVYVKASEKPGGYMIAKKQVQDLCSLCWSWSSNLNQQGFVEASLLPNWLTSTPEQDNE